MRNFVDQIKQISIGAQEAGNPVAVLFATVTGTSPLEVNVDQRFTLTEDFLIVPEHLTDRTAMVNGQQITLSRGLSQGDKVILIRQQGGLNFLVAGRLV